MAHVIADCHKCKMVFMSGRYKFDDERVTKEELKRALEEQYGGEEEVRVLFSILRVKQSRL